MKILKRTKKWKKIKIIKMKDNKCKNLVSMIQNKTSMKKLKRKQKEAKCK